MRKDLPAEMYDAAELARENRAYDALPHLAMAAVGYLRALGYPADRRGAMFYAASLCYPGQPGPVSAGEFWASGGGTTRGPVREHVHSPEQIAAVRRRGEQRLYSGRRAVSGGGAA